MTDQRSSTVTEDDVPTKWLVDRLRDLARELVADPKTPWIGERDPEQHICWTAADRILSNAQQPLTHTEKTKWGIIDWKMEVERLNRLLADAQRIITEYKARAIEVARGGAQAAPEPVAWSRETIARCLVNSDPNYSIYHMPGDEPREVEYQSGRKRKTSEISEEYAECVRVRADKILALIPSPPANTPARSPQESEHG